MIMIQISRDVLKILTSYRRVAGRDFGAELDQTIADMKTGNYENALIRFETLENQSATAVPIRTGTNSGIRNAMGRALSPTAPAVTQASRRS